MKSINRSFEVVYDTPYSSATEFYRWLEPKQLDPAMGEVCVRLTMEAAARARAAGATVYEVYDGRHVGAVAVLNDGSAYVLDPYLMPLDPLPISRAGWERRTADVKVSGPKLWNRSSVSAATVVRARLSDGPDEGWSLETELRFAEGSPQSRSIRHFCMPHTNRFVLDEFESRMARLLLDPEQTTVSIRVVHADRSGVTQAFLPLRRDGSRDGYRADAVQLKSSVGADPCAGWERLAASVGRSQQDICDYLVGAANLHADLLSGRRQL